VGVASRSAPAAPPSFGATALPEEKLRDMCETSMRERKIYNTKCSPKNKVAKLSDGTPQT